jgi:two-component system alkaline phosphatase synthesis response regulator PhoP
MIAEDEADIRNLLMMMVQVWGHAPIAYENGQKVWDWLDQFAEDKQPEPVPELVLMDIRMPGKKGNEIAQRMRTIPALKTVPIVLMTAYSLSDGERTEMLQEDGVDHIIAKPLPDFEQLRTLLQNMVDKKNGSTV